MYSSGATGMDRTSATSTANAEIKATIAVRQFLNLLAANTIVDA